MLTLLASMLFALVQADEPGKGRLPIQVPAGWQGKREEAAFVVTPKDLAAGRVFSVVSADLLEKVGSMKGLMDAGKATLAEAGTFKPSRDPAAGKTDGGWDYEILLGTLEKDGGALLAEVVGFRKGEDEGLVLVICDSVETLTKYSDGFASLVKSVGAPKAAPAPAAGKVDLRYKLPSAWTSREVEGGCVLLENGKDEMWDKFSFRILICPSEPLQGSLKQKFLEIWAATIKTSIETKIVPLPLVRRMKSGMAVAFDQDARATNKSGVQHHGGLYLLARGNRCVPILGFYFGLGNTKLLDEALESLIESAVIPGAGEDLVALVDPADVPGNWNTSSYEMANYVTSAGAYAGDASIATGDYLTLGKDGAFSKTAMAVTAKTRIKEKSEGTWKVEDQMLILLDKEGKAQSYRIFGAGSEPKAGVFLVLSNYGNTDEQPSLSIPRRTFSGTWFKRKD